MIMNLSELYIHRPNVNSPNKLYSFGLYEILLKLPDKEISCAYIIKFKLHIPRVK